MKTTTVGILLLMAFLASHVCANMHELTKAANLFGLKMYDELASNGNETKNIVFSPLSISLAMAMTYAGAAGDTKEQMKEVMNFDTAADSEENLHKSNQEVLEVFEVPSNPYVLRIANKLFGRKGVKFEEAFEDVTAEQYSALIEKLNFDEEDEVVEQINKWVAEWTKMKVRHFLSEDSLSEEPSLLLINAIYFGGEWAERFNENDTELRPFFHNEYDSVDIDMMYIETKLSYKTIPSLHCSMVEIPYTGNKLAMYVILPWEKTGLDFLETEIGSYDFDKLFSNLTKQRVKVSLPKFEMEKDIDLKLTLTALGITDLFNESLAVLSGICMDENLHVSDAKHRSFVEVDEKGGKPAVPSEVSTDGRAEHALFDANHPFMFFIQEQTTKAVVLMGRYVGPGGTASVTLHYTWLIVFTSVVSLYYQI